MLFFLLPYIFVITREGEEDKSSSSHFAIAREPEAGIEPRTNRFAIIRGRPSTFCPLLSLSAELHCGPHSYQECALLTELLRHKCSLPRTEPTGSGAGCRLSYPGIEFMWNVINLKQIYYAVGREGFEELPEGHSLAPARNSGAEVLALTYLISF